MNQPPQPSFAPIPFLLPLVLAANLVLLLFLLVQTRNLEELKGANERDLSTRQQLEAEMPRLQKEFARLAKAQQSLQVDIKTLEEAKLAAQRIIAGAQQAEVHADQLRQTEKNLAASIQTQTSTNNEREEALAAIVQKTAVANAQLKESKDRLSELSRQLAVTQTDIARLQKDRQALEAELKSLGEAKAEVQTISSQIEPLRRAAKTMADSLQAQNQATANQAEALAELIQNTAAANTELRKAKASLESLEAENTTRRKQLEGLAKQEIDWAELARVRAERAELLGRNDVTRGELKAAEARIRDLERQREELSVSVAALDKRNAELKRATPPMRESTEKK